jgi:hypothetical protein
VLYVTFAFESVVEEKDFKKILKQNKNVLVLGAPSGECFSCLVLSNIVPSIDLSAKSTLQLFKQVEPDIKGRGLFVYINCE